VEAISGEEYGIRLRNKSATQTLACYVYVDGESGLTKGRISKYSTSHITRLASCCLGMSW
jgi:hypothetical protein